MPGSVRRWFLCPVNTDHSPSTRWQSDGSFTGSLMGWRVSERPMGLWQSDGSDGLTGLWRAEGSLTGWRVPDESLTGWRVWQADGSLTGWWVSDRLTGLWRADGSLMGWRVSDGLTGCWRVTDGLTGLWRADGSLTGWRVSDRLTGRWWADGSLTDWRDICDISAPHPGVTSVSTRCSASAACSAPSSRAHARRAPHAWRCSPSSVTPTTTHSRWASPYTSSTPLTRWAARAGRALNSHTSLCLMFSYTNGRIGWPGRPWSVQVISFDRFGRGRCRWSVLTGSAVVGAGDQFWRVDDGGRVCRDAQPQHQHARVSPVRLRGLHRRPGWTGTGALPQGQSQGQ